MSTGAASNAVSLIFVYGTLKRGFANHWLIEELMHTGDAAYVGPRTTVDAFPLVCGPHGIPYLINLPGSGRRVRGELYSVTSDAGRSRLDDLEGVDRGHYVRLAIAVEGTVGDGERVVEAEAYFAHPDFGESLWSRSGEDGLFSDYTAEMGDKYVPRDERPPGSVFLQDIKKFIQERS